MFLGIFLFLSLIVPFAQSDRATTVVNASDGVPIHYSVQGTGHYPMLENPARFNQLLSEF
jgi:pimeloyl-ACP methyl ester carboxylesterase